MSTVQPGVPGDDRGLAYGDGVFETLAVARGVAAGLDRHLARLARGCAALGFAPPPQAHVRAAVEDACRAPGHGVVKVVVTRGSGGRGYAPPPEPKPRLLVSRHAWPEAVARMRARGVAAARLDARLGINPALAGIKHLARLEQVLAAAELAARHGVEEGVVCDVRGRPVCGVQSNLFLVRGGTLLTPALTGCGVAGIIRDAILELARDGALAPAVVRDVAPQELEEAEEMFLTNSVRGVVPVARLDARALPAPGPMACAAGRALAAAGLLA